MGGLLAPHTTPNLEDLQGVVFVSTLSRRPVWLIDLPGAQGSRWHSSGVLHKPLNHDKAQHQVAYQLRFS